VPWDWDEFAGNQAHYAAIGLAVPPEPGDDADKIGGASE